MAQPYDRFVWQHRRRLASFLLLTLVATGVAATGPLHRAVLSVIAAAEPVIREHAVAGAVVYVALSAFSAIVFFFSTAVITPVAVDAFGPLAALAMLWLGWILGGITAYGIGRRFGRKVVSWLVDPVHIRNYERRAKQLVSFRHMLLFQLAVPSEIPGYVLGLAGCRFRTFVLAIALGELPFAVGAVYLGESFLNRNYAVMLAIGILGSTFSWITFQRAARIWTSDSKTSDSAAGGAINGEDRRDGGGENAEVFIHAEPERSAGANTRP